MRDLAILASHIVRDYPEEYKVFSEPQFTFNGITQQNRNPVLGLVEGVDGMKTGHTAESGYGLVASAARNGQRLILALNGLRQLTSAGRRPASCSSGAFAASSRPPWCRLARQSARCASQAVRCRVCRLFL